MNDDSTAGLAIPSLAEALAGQVVPSRNPSIIDRPRGRVHRLSNQAPPRAPLEERLEPPEDEPLPAACIPGDTVPFGTRMPETPADAPPAPIRKGETRMPKKKAGDDAFDERKLVLDAVHQAKGPISSGQVSKAVGLSTFKINKVLAALEGDGEVSKAGKGSATRWTAGKGTAADAPKVKAKRTKASGPKPQKRAAAAQGDPPTFTVDDAGAIAIFQDGQSMKLNLAATRRLALFIDRTKTFRV